MAPAFPDLARIKDMQARFGLFATLDPERISEEFRRAAPDGPLQGYVVGLKANIALSGARWSAGLPHRANKVATEDANVVRRLRASGARVLPGLNMDAAALGGMTDNADFGRTENPTAPGHLAGGSSGGSAAAVASGLVDVALGSDTLGSIRIPASYCGIYGLKPSFGLVGRSGIVPLASSLDVVGPLTRRAADLWPVLLAIAGEDVADPDSRCAPIGWGSDGPVTDLSGLKIGIPEEISKVDCAPEILTALEQTKRHLRHLGAEVRPVSMPAWRPADLRQAAFLLTEIEGAAQYAPELAEGQILPELVEKLLLYGSRLSAEKRAAVHQALRELRNAADEVFSDLDLLLMPTTPHRAVPAGARVPANQADFTALANVTGMPALAIPVVGPEQGRPASVQLVGPAWSEPLLIGVAISLEQQTLSG